MAIERTFLGWDRPCLHLAVDWLERRFAPVESAGRDSGETWDLSLLLITLPGSRALRRLGELLAQRAAERRWVLWPPTMVTQGQLPERLYESSTTAIRVADDWSSALAWLAALRRSPADDAAVLAPASGSPGDDDVAGWLATTDELMAVVRDLAGEELRPGDVLAKLGGRADFPDVLRWEALSRLHERYEAILAELGLGDRDAARRTAILNSKQHVVLIGCVDLTGIAASMLHRLDTPVDVLIHAPQMLDDAFDDAGVLRVEHWAARHVDIPDHCINVVNAPRDQAHEVVRILERHGARYAADQITIGLGDETQAAMIGHTLDLIDLPARSAIGTPLAASAPLQLLSALGRFIGSRRFDDLAALLRHPDAEAYVDHTQGVAHWLTLLDRYANDHLQRRLTGTWLGDPQTATSLKHVYDAVTALLPFDAYERRPLPRWASPIADALAKVYARRTLRRYDEHDRRVIEALSHIGKALRQLAGLDPDATITPHVTIAEAIRLLASRVANTALPQPGGDAAIELVGWLELPLDDSPILIVTGMNEGHVPAARGPDPWLPDTTRRALGLPDDRRRLGRDTLLLTTMLHSRPDMHLIACRRTAQGDPVPPSRLLLACDPIAQAQRLMSFYDEHPTVKAPLLLLKPGVGRFIIPRPPADLPPINRLSVTAFADYIACPYRFYLKHVLKLAALDDQAIEMGGDVFGDLAHAILDDFGKLEVTGDASGNTAGGAAMDQLLDARVRDRFGDAPAPAVLLQCRLLRERLHALARWHARERDEGWRIIHTEKKLELPMLIDGDPFTLTGKIDRIDQRVTPGSGARYRILDYKTGDQARTPEQVHRTGPKDQRLWSSLQLPLYRKLVKALGIFDQIELGYVLLPRDLDKTGYAMATWDEQDLLTAEDEAMRIIRAIRNGVFWPPRAPIHEDDFAGICLDGTIDGVEFRRRLREEPSS